MTKRVDALLIGDTIVEVEIVKKKKKHHLYKVSGIRIAACSPTKTHVDIDSGTRHWCYDSAYEVDIL